MVFIPPINIPCVLFLISLFIGGSTLEADDDEDEGRCTVEPDDDDDEEGGRNTVEPEEDDDDEDEEGGGRSTLEPKDDEDEEGLRGCKGLKRGGRVPEEGKSNETPDDIDDIDELNFDR